MILAFMLLNGLILRIATSPSLAGYEWALIQLGDHLILGIFIVEALIKMIEVVINNLDEAKVERLIKFQGPVTPKEIPTDLREKQIALKWLEARLEMASS